MKLDAFALTEQRIDLRSAPLEREWMDASDQRYAYRCLPLNIANGCGWEMACPGGFTATWNGGPDLKDLTVVPDAASPTPALSHFGQGILTFHVPALFRTEPGFDLIVQGPVNRPKDGICALSGVVETDWAPFTFTMNWKLTRADHAVRFEAGEPYCHIMPVRRSDLENFTPRHRTLASEPDLKSEYDAWQVSRAKFLQSMAAQDPSTLREGWQKHYFQGKSVSGSDLHSLPRRTKVRLPDFGG